MPCFRRLFPVTGLFLRLALVLLASGPGLATAAFAAAPDSELKLVVMLTRHGVRSPLQTNETLGKFAAEPWPAWTVKPGILTPHGRQQMVVMGAYYRERFLADGLLSGDPAKDAPLLFLRSDNDQRDVESSRALAEALLPGGPIPEVHALPAGKIDPLYQPVKAGTAVPDRELAIAAVLGRIGQDPANLLTAYRTEFATLEQVLFGPGGTPSPGKTSLFDLPGKVMSGGADATVRLDGFPRIAQQITDALLLEYTEGMPMKDVGWGRLSPAQLTEVLKLHSLYFDLTQATFYPAQVQVSNFADHLLSTLEQSAQGRAVPGAFGTPATKLVIAAGHDTNIINLGGLLGLTWYLPGTQQNPVLPGGALMLELRHRPSTGAYVVRLYYVSPTLDQSRNLTPLTLAHPPGFAPLFVPGLSESGPGYDVPLDQFEALLRRTIDPKFVTPGVP